MYVVWPRLGCETLRHDYYDIGSSIFETLDEGYTNLCLSSLFF